eukprot:CAMPEP_0203844174 /NCGR_PEP_ID=MMETSP0359-20131031/3035_1 /ASSEMBLY_ACC=CAM_ASM_000338 /TAXON_ID=268821 /ORGANISM="Scrippsiella Hangoei, Strain SHTV-5" /LENGTH=47 /DNA_ID= /DNA_START= /DNA_END= /DNA_ORIENTATION=
MPRRRKLYHLLHLHDSEGKSYGPSLAEQKRERSEAEGPTRRMDFHKG